MAKQKRSKKARKAKKQQRRLAKLEIKRQKGQVSQEQYQKTVNKLRGTLARTLTKKVKQEPLQEITIPDLGEKEQKEYEKLNKLISNYKDVSKKVNNLYVLLSIQQQTLTMPDVDVDSVNKEIEDTKSEIDKLREQLSEIKTSISDSIYDAEIEYTVNKITNSLDNESKIFQNELEGVKDFVIKQSVSAFQDKTPDSEFLKQQILDNSRMKEHLSRDIDNSERKLQRQYESKRAVSVAEIINLSDNLIFVTALEHLSTKVQDYIVEVIQDLIAEGRIEEVSKNLNNLKGQLSFSILKPWQRYENLEAVEEAALNMLDVIYGNKTPTMIKQGLNWSLYLDERLTY